MVVKAGSGLLFFAAGLFFITAFGLSQILRGYHRQPPDVFAKPANDFHSQVDKLSEQDFFLSGVEPGTKGRPPPGTVGEKDGVMVEEVEDFTGVNLENVDTGSFALDEQETVVGEASEIVATTLTTSITSAAHAPAQTDASDAALEDDPFADFEKSDEENVQEGEDISYLLTEEQHAASNKNQLIPHNEVFSNMTADSRWFLFDFINHGAYNPNIIPHPYKENTWIIVAQRDKQYDDNIIWNVELVCEASYSEVHKKFRCHGPPTILPIASTASDYCEGDIAFFNSQIGPHDARVFYGPDKPYIIYGSQSDYNCLGQWIQDFRRLTDFSRERVTNRTQRFFWATNLQRPGQYRMIEKNWFPFWDTKGDMYMHYDLEPKRVFAKLNDDGSVGPDLAPLAKTDPTCMEKYMPKLNPTGLEWIHQGTNSLAITMCRRADPDCVQTEENTFIFTIIQTKTFYMHGVYEPYVFMFKQQAPFEVHAISSIPFWYHGRGHPGERWTNSTWKPKDQSEMVFTVSMSWKEPGMMYHGYLDDTLFICFGIEDNHGGAIDVVAGDLMKDLAYC